MESKVLTPKFLTHAIAARATEVMLKATIFNPLLKGTFDGTLHVVVLVPSMKDERDQQYPSWPNYQVEPHCLFEQGTENENLWKYLPPHATRMGGGFSFTQPTDKGV